MKKVIKGWIGKATYKQHSFFACNGDYKMKLTDLGRLSSYIWNTKGKEHDWGKGQWPPMRIKIKVEVDECK